MLGPQQGLQYDRPVHYSLWHKFSLTLGQCLRMKPSRKTASLPLPQLRKSACPLLISRWHSISLWKSWVNSVRGLEVEKASFLLLPFRRQRRMRTSIHWRSLLEMNFKHLIFSLYPCQEINNSIIPLYRWENEGLGSNSPKVLWQINGKAGIWTHV